MKRPNSGAFPPIRNFPTLPTAARSINPVPESIPTLRSEFVLGIATRVDKFEALHAMAVTCKAWNRTLENVFVWLKAVACADHKTSGRMLKHEHALMPKAKAIDFALSWLESRLSKHRADEPPETINRLVRGAINLIGRQRKATGIPAMSCTPPSPSAELFLSVFSSIEMEIRDEPQRDAFHTAVFMHRSAVVAFGSKCVIRESERCYGFVDDGKLLLANLHDQILCDAIYRVLAIKTHNGVQTIDRLNAILDQVPVETILRWLSVKDTLVRDHLVNYSLVDHVLDNREIPRGCGKILAEFIDPLNKERFGRFITIDRNPVKYANFVEVTFSNEKLLKSLIEHSGMVLSGLYVDADKEDAQLAKNFLQLVVGSERGITVEAIAAWCDEAARNRRTLDGNDPEGLGLEDDLGWIHGPGLEGHANSGAVIGPADDIVPGTEADAGSLH